MEFQIVNERLTGPLILGVIRRGDQFWQRADAGFNMRALSSYAAAAPS
jgi:hypothetical protein